MSCRRCCFFLAWRGNCRMSNALPVWLQFLQGIPWIQDHGWHRHRLQALRGVKCTDVSSAPLLSRRNFVGQSARPGPLEITVQNTHGLGLRWVDRYPRLRCRGAIYPAARWAQIFHNLGRWRRRLLFIIWTCLGVPSNRKFQNFWVLQQSQRKDVGIIFESRAPDPWYRGVAGSYFGSDSRLLEDKARVAKWLAWSNWTN